MKYQIEVNDELDKILHDNAAKRNMSVPELISEMLKRYAIDSHIMEQNDLWKTGIDEYASINLDWANL